VTYPQVHELTESPGSAAQTDGSSNRIPPSSQPAPRTKPINPTAKKAPTRKRRAGAEDQSSSSQPAPRAAFGQLGVQSIDLSASDDDEPPAFSFTQPAQSTVDISSLILDIDNKVNSYYKGKRTRHQLQPLSSTQPNPAGMPEFSVGPSITAFDRMVSFSPQVTPKPKRTKTQQQNATPTPSPSKRSGQRRDMAETPTRRENITNYFSPTPSPRKTPLTARPENPVDIFTVTSLARTPLRTRLEEASNPATGMSPMRQDSPIHHATGPLSPSYSPSPLPKHLEADIDRRIAQYNRPGFKSVSPLPRHVEAEIDRRVAQYRNSDFKSRSPSRAASRPRQLQGTNTVDLTLSSSPVRLPLRLSASASNRRIHSPQAHNRSNMVDLCPSPPTTLHQTLVHVTEQEVSTSQLSVLASSIHDDSEQDENEAPARKYAWIKVRKGAFVYYADDDQDGYGGEWRAGDMVFDMEAIHVVDLTAVD
jgi:hypothetical protein